MIKPLAANDLRSYKKLRLLSLRHDPDSYLSEFEVEKHKSDDHFLVKLLTDRGNDIFGYLGYFLNNDLIAYLQLSGNNLPKTSHVVYLYEVFVHPENRRKGVATKLVQHVIEKCRSTQGRK